MKRLNIHSIVADLNDLCLQLDDNFNINNGGCCYVAYEIAKHLDQLGIEYELRIYDDYNKNEKAINEEVRNKRCNKSHSTSVVRYYSCTHYFLFIRGAGPINEGDFSDHYNRYSISNIDHKHIKWIYKNGLWNDIYQTNNNILIKKLIKLYFDEYKIYKNNNMQMS